MRTIMLKLRIMSYSMAMKIKIFTFNLISGSSPSLPCLESDRDGTLLSDSESWPLLIGHAEILGPGPLIMRSTVRRRRRFEQQQHTVAVQIQRQSKHKLKE